MTITAKTKTQFTCNACGAHFPKWTGQCSECQEWNTLIEERISTRKNAGYAGIAGDTPVLLNEVNLTETARVVTEIEELDRVLGGGIVAGACILLGGDPGIGKSTLLLQTLAHLSQKFKTLYITGEESLQQVRLRAERLHLEFSKLYCVAETSVERIIATLQQQQPNVIVVDSIQTLYTETLTQAPGSVSQLREATAKLVQYAKQHQTAVFIVGHVTKEGMLAGPRVLEHMVDTVLYFEGDTGNRYRVLRAVKNRFGAVNELGIFAMTEKGLREVNNPSAIFLSRSITKVPGSVVMVTWEGTRPLLVEVQALVDQSHMANPRRVTVGLDYPRLSMLLAVLHRHAGIASYDQDVFVNVVGGMRIQETAADLALLLAVVSSLRNKPLPEDLIAFGEVGLAGEIRPVPFGQERLKAAAKQGFKTAIIPKANVAKQDTNLGLKIIAVERLQEAFQF